MKSGTQVNYGDIIFFKWKKLLAGFPRIGDTDSNCMHLDFRSFPSAEDMLCDYENAHYPICQMFI